jgi:hypothetical protein
MEAGTSCSSSSNENSAKQLYLNKLDEIKAFADGEHGGKSPSVLRGMMSDLPELEQAWHMETGTDLHSEDYTQAAFTKMHTLGATKDDSSGPS